MRGDVTVDQRTALDDWASGRTQAVRPHRRHDGAADRAGRRRPGPSRSRCRGSELRSADAFAARADLGRGGPAGRDRAHRPDADLRRLERSQGVRPAQGGHGAARDARPGRRPLLPRRRLAAVGLAAGHRTRLARGPHPRGHQRHARSTSPSTRPCSARRGPASSGSSSGSGGATPTPSGTRPGHPGDDPRLATAPGTTPPTAPTTTPTTTPTTQGTPPSQAAATIARLGDERRDAAAGPQRVGAALRRRRRRRHRCASTPRTRWCATSSAARRTLATRLGQPARADIVWPVDGLMPARTRAGHRDPPVRHLGQEGRRHRRQRGSGDPGDGIHPDRAAGHGHGDAAARLRPPAVGAAARHAPIRARSCRCSATSRRRSCCSVSEPARPVPSSSRRRAPTTPTGLPSATFLAATSSAPWLEPVDAASLLSDSGAEQAVRAGQSGDAGRVRRSAGSPHRAPPRPDGRAARHAAQRVVGAARRRGVRAHLPRGARRARERRGGATSPARGPRSPPRSAKDIRAATSAIRVVPRTSTINLLAEKGTLRITVENGLDYTVEDIRLRLVPDNPRIQVVEQPGPMTIGPLSRTNVPVEVAAVAAGTRRDPRLPHDCRRHPDRLPGDHPDGGQPARRRHLLGRRACSWASCCWPVSPVPSLKGTSRIDEIADIEAVTAAHVARRCGPRGSTLTPPRMMASHAARHDRRRGG